eukprot:6431764-Amphidinium_carterae.1
MPFLRGKQREPRTPGRKERAKEKRTKENARKELATLAVPLTTCRTSAPIEGKGKGGKGKGKDKGGKGKA